MEFNLYSRPDLTLSVVSYPFAKYWDQSLLLCFPVKAKGKNIKCNSLSWFPQEPLQVHKENKKKNVLLWNSATGLQSE